MDEPFARGWAGSRSPKLLIVGEAFGEQEDREQQPFVRASGHELWRMLGEAIHDEPELHQRALALLHYGNAWIKERRAWLEACGIAFTNVLNFRPPNNQLDALCTTRLQASPAALQWPSIGKGLYLHEDHLHHVQRLHAEIALAQPNLVVAAGNTACWALLQATNIGSIRGAVTQATLQDGTTVKVLPTYHPAGVLRQWSWRPVVVADLIKAWREAQFAELRRPQRRVLVSPSLDEVDQWAESALANAQMLACDIETGAGQIKCVGFASSVSDALVVPFVDQQKLGYSYWERKQDEIQAWRAVQSLLESPLIKVFQNGLYDLQYLLRLGFRPQNCLEDTMLLHHSLYPELQKGLGFLGSIYSNEASWKLMRRNRPDSEKRDE